MDNFNLMIEQMKFVSGNLERQFVGALLRPTAAIFRRMMDMGTPVDDILDAAKEAGRQLVEDGEMSAGTLDIVSRELMPLQMYMQSINHMFQQTLDALERD